MKPYLPGFLAAWISLCFAVAADPSPAVKSSDFVYEKGPFPQCHASTIVETSKGSLLAAFFGGTHEKHPDVCIWLSRFEDGRWSAPIEVANGIQSPTLRYPTWNPVLFQPGKGPLMLFYKIGPSPSEWWGMLMTSDDDGRTWSKPQRLPDGILGPIKNKPVELADGTILSPSSTESKESGWQIHFEMTKDLGKTWVATPPLNTKDQFNAIQPSVLLFPNGRLEALSRTRENVLSQIWSDDNGKTWGTMSATDIQIPNSGSDAVTLRDGRQLLVYNHHDANTPKEELNKRCPLNVAISDDGKKWKMVAALETEPVKAGYAYPAVIQARDGLVHITYSWNRERIKHVVLDPAKL